MNARADGAVVAVSVLDTLRQATAACHQQIEARMNWGDSMDLARYGRVLQGFDAFLAGWEPAVRAALPARLHAWFDGRTRRGMLRHDLQVLGLPTLRDAHAVMDVDSSAAAFGSLYVMEGSALGGQLIARQLAQQHGLDADSGARYFIGWGAETGVHWREFRALCEREVGEHAADRGNAATAAVATFNALLRQFERCGALA